MPNPRPARAPWTPTRVLRVEESYDTSMGTAKVKTDATFAYLKAMGNREGPHALASELVGSGLAAWFGLTVPSFAVINLPAESCFDLRRGCRTAPGPAFVSRHVPGRTWGGSAAELACLDNPKDVTRLVVFDTWVRNRDRHPPDPSARKPNYANVYLADVERPGRFRLIAIDHTHCFGSGQAIGPRVGDIDAVRDEGTYGLFPAFRPLIDAGELAWCKAMLRTLSAETVRGIVVSIPPDWEVAAAAADALTALIVRRAAFLADRIDTGWPTA
jgi:hypothetical protein